MAKIRPLRLLSIVAIALVVILTLELILASESKNALSSGVTPIEAFLPRPSKIIMAYFENASVINKELMYTLSRSMIGLLIGMVLAIVIAFAAFLSKGFNAFANPFLQAINSFPIIGFAPLIILVFGQGSNLGIIFISMLLAYFPIYVSVYHAINNIPVGVQELSASLNTSRTNDFLHIRLSEIKSPLVASLKLAFPASIIGATIGEWLGTNHGIGQLVTVSLYRFQPEIMYASLFVLVIVNLVALWVIVALEKRVSPWI
jgi:ABC-type nitrate/sulfonate/bicarbonate transport system permease component